MQWIEEGSPTAPLWLVGEAPGDYEWAHKRPFIGPTGAILDSCCRDTGIDRSSVFLTNVCHEQPPPYTDKHGKVIKNDIEQFFHPIQQAKATGADPYQARYPRPPLRRGCDHLDTLMRQHNPRCVALLGNTALWWATAQGGITKWRGSSFRLAGRTPAVATVHPADLLQNRSPQLRPIFCHDLERALRVLEDPSLADPPQWNHLIEPSYADVRNWLGGLTAACPLACDIETRAGQIACIGFASSLTEAICVPFMRAQPAEHGHSFYDPDTELAIVAALSGTLTRHPLTFHNGLFDCQYLARQWGLLPPISDDTMVMQHVAFPGFLGGKIDPVSGKVDKRGSSLSLSFISSLYCQRYRFWKDDGRLFDPTDGDERRFWRYNCEDCCRTYECRDALAAILHGAHLTDQYQFLLHLYPAVFNMMFTGIAIDRPAMAQMHRDILADRDAAQHWLNVATGTDFNCESTPQMRALFYHDLALPLQRNKHTKAPTLDDTALTRIARHQPLLRPLIEKIQDYRTLDTIKDDVGASRLSSDGRLRTALNPAYVETFRFSSNQTAFGEGGNLQNIPRPPED